MPSIPLGLASFKRLDLPPTRLRNYYYEKAPSNQEDQVSLVARPALVPYAQVGDGPMRGVYRSGGVIAGRILALSGGDLYRVGQTGQDDVGTGTLIGAIEGDARMSASGNVGIAVLTAGTKVYQTDGSTLTQIEMPDDFDCLAVDFLGGYFLFVKFSSQRFYWTGPGDLVVDALNYASAEAHPDHLYTLKVARDELWLFGRQSIEVWAPTGNADLPFKRISGRIFGIGITARDTLQRIEQTLLWVGTDRRVYITNPNPTVISDKALEERLERADPASLYAFTYTSAGHDFYALQIPDEGTFVYDLATGLWDEATTYGQALFRGQAACLGPNNQTLIGDIASSDIWEMSPTAETDGMDPIVYEFPGQIEATGRCNSVQLECSTGTTDDPEADPMVELRFSDDNGHTWDDWMAEPLGRMGEYDARPAWTALGTMRRRRLFQWRTTKRLTVTKAKINEDLR